jgi:hypothetical protein
VVIPPPGPLPSEDQEDPLNPSKADPVYLIVPVAVLVEFPTVTPLSKIRFKFLTLGNIEVLEM